VQKLISHQQLDRRLDRLAKNPDGFAEKARSLARQLDRDDMDLEITRPESWRRSRKAESRPSFAQQFRADVDAILPLDRDEEARLARRIEFARLRLEIAREEAPEGTPETTPERNGIEHADAEPATKSTSRRVKRRSMELHALRSEMVERNLYLVLINVERYAQGGASRLDLIQEGCVSLFRAVDGFDWRRGLLFRTYAVHWLNQAFRNFLYNSTHTVRVPVYLQKALKHINQATIRLGDPNASPEQIAEQSEGLNAGLVAAAQRAARASYSIDADHPLGQEGSRLRDLLEAGEETRPEQLAVEDYSLEDGLAKALSVLGERERRVLEMRFGLGRDRECTLAEVARELGVSVERVRQIQVRALDKLNTPSLRRELDAFLN